MTNKEFKRLKIFVNNLIVKGVENYHYYIVIHPSENKDIDQRFLRHPSQLISGDEVHGVSYKLIQKINFWGNVYINKTSRMTKTVYF